MRLGAYQFKPRLIPSLLTALTLPVLLSLGFWQLDRSDQKQDARALVEQNYGLPVSDVGAVIDDPRSALYRRVRLEGRFDAEHHVLMVNRPYRGEPGFDVYAPFEDYRSGRWLLVNRGWLAADRGQGAPPVPAPSPDVTRLQGVVSKPPSVGLKLGAPAVSAQAWPRQVQYIDFDWLDDQLPQALEPLMVVQRRPSPDGLVDRWDPQMVSEGGMPAEKHVSYAVQWFALAFTLLIIFLVVNLSRLPEAERHDGTH